jgi:hypothetical protein
MRFERKSEELCKGWVHACASVYAHEEHARDVYPCKGRITMSDISPSEIKKGYWTYSPVSQSWSSVLNKVNTYSFQIFDPFMYQPFYQFLIYTVVIFSCCQIFLNVSFGIYTFHFFVNNLRDIINSFKYIILAEGHKILCQHFSQ